jgi:hypothetical protein
LDALVQTALRTSEIEGETLNAGSVRSSVVRKLGNIRIGGLRGDEPMRVVSGRIDRPVMFGI